MFKMAGIGYLLNQFNYTSFLPSPQDHPKDKKRELNISKFNLPASAASSSETASGGTPSSKPSSASSTATAPPRYGEHRRAEA